MAISYESDYAAWAFEQVTLLRAGRFNEIDAAHIAEEIEDVGRAEYRTLRSRMAVLIEHLLKWRFLPASQGGNWRRTIANERMKIELLLEDSPSLRCLFSDEVWLSRVWRHAQRLAHSETGIIMPGYCLWTVQQVLDMDFLPD